MNEIRLDLRKNPEAIEEEKVQKLLDELSEVLLESSIELFDALLISGMNLLFPFTVIAK